MQKRGNTTIIDLIITSMMLGVGLAMDAFSVSLANGLTYRKMKSGRMAVVAGTFGFFQFAMPLIGWALVNLAAGCLLWFNKLIPWIALLLLAFLGGKMIMGGLKERKCCKDAEYGADDDAASCIEESGPRLELLAVQGVATSIDALSVGFTTSSYGINEALISSFIIGVVTFVICVAGLLAGRRAGTMLSWKASVLGGLILLAIGVKMII